MMIEKCLLGLSQTIKLWLGISQYLPQLLRKESLELISLVYRRPDNPSFKIFEFDADTNVQVNEEVYRLDLAYWNNKSHDYFEFEKAYNYLDYYNVSNMSLGTRAWINE